MNSRFVGILMFVMIIACVIAGAIVYPHLSGAFVSHWNASGQANGTLGKFWGVSVFPFVMLVLVGIWALLPHIDPIAPEFKGFRKVYDFFFLLLIAFFAYVYALVLRVNLGLQFQIIQMLLPALALLIFTLGALLPHLKRNWFMGIRTPWTISNDVVWQKTHKLGSRLFEIAALIVLLAAFVPRPLSIMLAVGSLIGAALISVVYSYVVFQKLQK